MEALTAPRAAVKAASEKLQGGNVRQADLDRALQWVSAWGTRAAC